MHRAIIPPLPGLNLYWRNEGFHPLLIRVEEWLVGFALINMRSHYGESIEHNMAEFFVARKHRRRGVATEAVRQILARYPGRWEVAVAERNRGQDVLAACHSGGAECRRSCSA